MDKKRMVPNSNNNDNFEIILNQFWGVPYMPKVELTSFEIKAFESYIYEELKLPNDKSINFNSTYLKFMFDFYRYYDFMASNFEM